MSEFESKLKASLLKRINWRRVCSLKPILTRKKRSLIMVKKRKKLYLKRNRLNNLEFLVRVHRGSKVRIIRDLSLNCKNVKNVNSLSSDFNCDWSKDLHHTKRLSNKIRRTRKYWFKRYCFRSQRFKQTFKTMYNELLWEELREFALGVESIKLNYKSTTILGLENEYRADERFKKVYKSSGGFKTILRVDLGDLKEENSLGKKKKKENFLLKSYKRRKNFIRGFLDGNKGYISLNSVSSKKRFKYNIYDRLKKKWSLRKGLNGRCYITQTRNNLFVVLMCDQSAKVIMEKSAGKLGYKGAAKRTRLVAVQLGRGIGKESYLRNYRTLTLYLRGRISMLARGVVQGLRLEDVKIKRLVYVREIAHNGVRLKKSRRM